MMIRSFVRVCRIAYTLAFSIVMGATTTTAAASEVSAAIDKFMASYTHDLVTKLGSGSRVDYTAPAIASSSETRSCATPLVVSAKDPTQSLNRVTLLAACSNQWSIYVPVDLDIYRPVVVATRPLANGVIVTKDDVELSLLDVGQLAGTYLTALDDAIGMGVKRPIMQGRPLLSLQLEQPLLIRRGEMVVINAAAGVLAVKMTGTALTDGHRGEQIRIKNQTSSRIIDARVTAPNQVTVAM
jgi:flagellar basal body P-ring formation protein FlgA